MSKQMSPCCEYDGKASPGQRCRAGHMGTHLLCRGVVHDYPAGAPSCMSENPPPHIFREDGMPLGWPVSMVPDEQKGGA
jgi:hypothetical protein